MTVTCDQIIVAKDRASALPHYSTLSLTPKGNYLISKQVKRINQVMLEKPLNSTCQGLIVGMETVPPLLSPTIFAGTIAAQVQELNLFLL